MKNFVIAILLVITIVVGYIAATSKLRLHLEGLEGESKKIVRGDLTLPINATGEIRPALRVEIKSEASGEVIEIARRAGDRVKAGELLIRLDPDNEQRNVSRAELDLVVAKSRVEDSKISIQLAKIQIDSATSRVAQLQTSVDFSLFRKEKVEALPPEQRNDEEVLQRRTTYEGQLSQLQGAMAELELAKLKVPQAQQTMHQAEATLATMQNNLADAQERLSETDIVCPIDGIVADMRTQIGEVIQGGKSTFTGGTVLAVVISTDRLLVKAEVDESDIGQVLKIAPPWASPGHASQLTMPEDLDDALAQAGQSPLVTVESFRDQEFKGVIERIYPEPRNISNVVTYMVDVVITSDNRHLLLPGMRADVRFTAEERTDIVLCPNEAIREGPQGKLGVYIPKPNAPAELRETEFIACKLGLDNGSNTEIVDGLAVGMTVYTKLPSKKDRDKDDS